MVTSAASSPVQHLQGQGPLEEVLLELNIDSGGSFLEYIHATLVHAYGVRNQPLLSSACVCDLGDSAPLPLPQFIVLTHTPSCSLNTGTFGYPKLLPASAVADAALPPSRPYHLPVW